MARPTIFTHPKFLLLRHLLGLSVPAALGYLECLWHVGYQSGNPFLGNAGCVELAACWEGDDGALAAALLESGFIDEGASGAYSIHDLNDHAPDYVRKRKLREDERKGKGPADNVRRTAPNVRPPAPAPAPALKSAYACSEPEVPASEQKSATATAITENQTKGETAVLVFPTVGRGPKEWPLFESKVREYAESYPGVDILAECRKALQWCRDNPTNKKTCRGMPAFLSRWLGRAQDGGRRGTGIRSQFGGPDVRRVDNAAKTNKSLAEALQ